MTTSKLRVGIGLIVILALAAAGLSGVLAADDTKAATEPAEKDVRYAMSFRANFAFQSDEPFVRGTFDDPDGFPGSDWGLPLSPSEAADLDERGRIRPLIQPAIEYALPSPTRVACGSTRDKAARPSSASPTIWRPTRRNWPD